MGAKKEMKKILPLWSMTLVALGIWATMKFAPAVFSQNQESDYNYQYEKYQEDHKVYSRTRSAYLEYSTLTSQQEFIDASLKFLKARSLTIKTYLAYLKYILVNTPDVVYEEKNYLNLTLDDNYQVLGEYEKEIDSRQAPSLNELEELSLRLERNEFGYRQLSYQALANIMIGRARSLKAESEAINFLLEERIAKGWSERKLETLNQWMGGAKENTYKAQKNIENAEASLKVLNDSSKIEDIAEAYKEIQEELESARQYLSGNIFYQNEIYKEVVIE